MQSPKILTTAAACALLLLAGCGGDGRDVDPAFTTQIFSDPALDGDIQQTDPTSFVVTQGMSATVQSVFAGIDPTTQTDTLPIRQHNFQSGDIVGSHAVLKTMGTTRVFSNIASNC